MDYVKKEDAIKAMNKAIDDRTWSMSDRDVMEQMEEYVKALPIADVVEVKHGEWVLKSEIHQLFDDVDEEFYVECPFCKRPFYVPFEFEEEKMLEYAKKNYPYCHCGAKMDGERK